MWRRAVEADGHDVITFCQALNDEDPGPTPVLAAQVERTPQTFQLEVSATNEDATRLYRRAGFTGSNVVLVRRSLGDELH